MNSLQLARFTIGFAWIYHGLFPKLVLVAPIEKAMTASLGLGETISYWITKSAGVAEIIFGLLFILLYKNKVILYLNIIGLVALLVFTIIMMPSILIEAFNPVTTNIPLMVLGIYLLRHSSDHSAQV